MVTSPKRGFMWIKLLLIALLLFIVFNLFRALFLMLKNDENQSSMSKFLGRRVWWSAIVVIAGDPSAAIWNNHSARPPLLIQSAG